MRRKAKAFLKRAGYRLRVADKITAVLMILVVCFGVCTITATAAEGGGSTEVNSNIGGQDMTISRFSELIAGTFSDNIAQSFNHKGATEFFMDTVDNGTEQGYGGDNHFRLGNVGNVLAYAGKRDTTANASNIWTDGVDAASKMMTLESLWEYHSGDPDKMVTSPMAQYIVWGSALNSMGIDEFRDAKGAADGTRMIIGYTAYVLFILAFSASNIMFEVVHMLQRLNVFMWVWNGLKGSTVKFMGELLGVDGSVEGLRSVPLLDEIIRILEEAMRLRWVILGIMVVLFVASLTVFKSKAYNSSVLAQQRGRKLVYRLIVMCIGIPLCGMLYTEGLDLIGTFDAHANKQITSYIFQEFLNFEGWTTQITGPSGYLLSFRTGGSSKASYSNIKVKYETQGQRFTVEHAPTSYSTYEPVDVNKLVYAINETIYGNDVTGGADDATYITTLYGQSPAGDDESKKNITYYDMVNGPGEWGTEPSKWDDYNQPVDDGVKLAYNACRDLLLNYARSATVKPDVLNSYYVSDMKDVSDMLYHVADGDTSSAANEAAANNATVMEQLFGDKAAEQRIWSYVSLPSPWIYPSTAGETVTLMENDDAKVELVLRGLSAISSGATNSGANSVYLQCNSGGNGVIMGSTLNNVFVRTAGPEMSGPPGTESVTVTAKGADMNGAATTIIETGNKINNYQYVYAYGLGMGGMSPLSMYNYLHSKFENGTITVYSPKLVSNAGISTMHYAVTTPYSGIPELVQLLFTIAVLFSLGIIGWVFGVSLLVNAIVQMCKALPVMVKMMMGSWQGFAEGLLIVFSVILEMLITIALYALSVHIIDFLVRIMTGVAKMVLSVFGSISGGEAAAYVDSETYSIMAGLMSTAVILWGTFCLLKWRVAITMSLKSAVTKIINGVLGTSAAMPTGASSGALKAAAGIAAGGIVAGSLAESGQLDDVVNDLTQSDLGTSVHDKIEDGDWEGAAQDIKDYANGTYEGGAGTDGEGDIDRGVNSEDWARERLGDGANSDSLDGSFGMQSLTDDQKAELDDKYKDDALAAGQKLDEARRSGDKDAIEEAQGEFNDVMQARARDAAEMRAENGRKARGLGVPDYGEHLRAQKAEAEVNGLKPIDGADIPDEPEKELTSDAQMAYDAARDGDAETLRSAAGIYDSNGLTKDQADEIDQMVADGYSVGEIAERVEQMAEDNFGENHAAVVDKMNEAAGRTTGALYGSSDNSEGKARTVAVASGHAEDGSRAYGVRDNSSDQGLQTFNTNSDGGLTQQFASELPEDPGQRLSAENQEIYDAAVSNDQDALKAAAETLDENGLTESQAGRINDMVAENASASDIAAQVDEYANANLGENHKAVMDRVNAAAGRGSSASYGKGVDPGDRSVSVRAKSGNMSGQGSDWGVTDSASQVAGEMASEATYQMDSDGRATELPTAISDVPSKDLTSENQAIFEAARDGDTGMLRQMAGHVNGNGLTADQERAVSNMIAGGASETEVAAAIDNFAQDNFGDDYKQVIDTMNDAVGRDSSVTYSAAAGGGADGTDPRSLSVESGYAEGKPAYSVDDLGTESGPSMIQVSDENGQSIYQDVTPEGSSGEQIVTSDFGSIDGQTYGSIRNEVDAVANASNGMLQRGSGVGDPGRTTVSEAASEIASRQSRMASGGRATAKIGSDGAFSGAADIKAYNKASQAAVKNTGLDSGEVAGISGGVDSHGQAVTTLPAAGDVSVQTDLRGDPVVNAGNGDGTAQLISADSVDNYGRSQGAMAQTLGVETISPSASNLDADGPLVGAHITEAADAGKTAAASGSRGGGFGTGGSGGGLSGPADAGAVEIPAANAMPVMGDAPGNAPVLYDQNGQAVHVSNQGGVPAYTDAGGNRLNASDVYASTSMANGIGGASGVEMRTSGDMPVIGSVNQDGSISVSGANGQSVSAQDVVAAAQSDGVQFHDAGGNAVKAVGNDDGTISFMNSQGQQIPADQVFGSAPVSHDAAARSAVRNAAAASAAPDMIPAAADIPAVSGGAGGAQQYYDAAGQTLTASAGANGGVTFTDASGNQVGAGSAYASMPVASPNGSGQGVQMYTSSDVPVTAVANNDGTVTMKDPGGNFVPAENVIQAAQGDGIQFHDAGGNAVQAVSRPNGTMSFVNAAGQQVPADQVFGSAPVSHEAANAVASSGAGMSQIPSGEARLSANGSVEPSTIPLAAPSGSAGYGSASGGMASVPGGAAVSGGQVVDVPGGAAVPGNNQAIDVPGGGAIPGGATVSGGASGGSQVIDVPGGQAVSGAGGSGNVVTMDAPGGAGGQTAGIPGGGAVVTEAPGGASGGVEIGGRKFTKQDIPLAVGLAAAATTFVKTGNLSNAAMAYMGTQNAAADIMGKVSGPAAPAGGQVQYAQSGGAGMVKQPAAYNAPGMAAVNTAAVSTPGGGNMIVARGSDGVIRTVGDNGQISNQAVAMTSQGSYQTVTQAPDGSLKTSGTGQAVVQTTDGSYVVTAKDSAGNMTVADNTGGSSGTMLTRTTDGYQPAAKAGNGVTYSVNEEGQPTGSVAVKQAGDANGGSVSVVRRRDGSVCMADKNGGATNVTMAAMADGSFAQVPPGNQIRTESGGTINVVKTVDGTHAGIVRTGGGTIQMANGDGSASGTVMAHLSDGTYAKVDAGGNTATLANGNMVQVVRMDDGGHACVARGSDGGWYMANANGAATAQAVHMTDRGWAPGSYDGSSRDSSGGTTTVVHETTHETVRETVHEAASGGTPDYSAMFSQPIQYGFDGRPVQPVPAPVAQQGPAAWTQTEMPQGPVGMNYMMMQQWAAYMGQGGSDPGSRAPAGGQAYMPEVIVPEANIAETSGERPDWDSGGNYMGSGDR